MTTARSLTSAYEIVDWTLELNQLPNMYGLTQELGIFRSEPVAQNVVQFEANNQTLGLVTDQYRGTRNTMSSEDQRKAHAYILAHFPLDDQLTARELVGKRAYGSADMAENEAAAIMRKMERIRKSHAMTKEVARVHTLVTGSQFAPNGTVSANFYTDFGVTQTTTTFSAASTSPTIIRDISRSAVDSIQKNIMSGETPNGFVALCNPDYFDKMVSQVGVIDAWRATQTLEMYNREGFRKGQYDEITFGNIRYIRYFGFRPDGSPMIPLNEAYILPLGTQDTFVTYHGPAERFDTINTLGEEAYMWTQRSEDNTSIKISSESNFANLIRRPQCIVKSTATA
jgi:hypothetical protein